MRQRAKFNADRSNHCRDLAIFRFFKKGGHPPSWIHFARVWTTHEEYLVVLITVQNLVGIGIVVFVICKF